MAALEKSIGQHYWNQNRDEKANQFISGQRERDEPLELLVQLVKTGSE
jgi:hypothetical protein